MVTSQADKEKDDGNAPGFERPTPNMLSAARTLLGMTQSDLAAAAGLSFSSVNRIEKGVDGIRLGTLDKMIATLAERGARFGRGEIGDVEAVIISRMPIPADLTWPLGGRLLREKLAGARPLSRPTPSMVAGARQLLGWSQRETAQAAGVSQSSLMRFETQAVSTRVDTLDRICKVLARRGIRFINADEEIVAGIVLLEKKTSS